MYLPRAPIMPIIPHNIESEIGLMVLLPLAIQKIKGWNRQTQILAPKLTSLSASGIDKPFLHMPVFRPTLIYEPPTFSRRIL